MDADTKSLIGEVKSRLDRPVDTLNNNLPAMRCYHCNRSLSMYYAQSLQTNDLLKFFEKHLIDRYCCRMIILQDHLQSRK